MTATSPVALVTGASSGIGKAATPALADTGFQVIGTSRHTSHATPGNDVTFLDLDVTSDESVTNVVGQVIARFGRLDVLVNNAGSEPTARPRRSPSPRRRGSSTSMSSASCA